MKIYSLMPFDAFNGSLVDYCLVHVAGLKLVTYSHIQGTRRAKSPKECALAVTGLTGAGPVRLLAGEPVRLCVLQGDSTPMAG
jgi:hypothetical protein